MSSLIPTIEPKSGGPPWGVGAGRYHLRSSGARRRL